MRKEMFYNEFYGLQPLAFLPPNIDWLYLLVMFISALANVQGTFFQICPGLNFILILGILAGCLIEGLESLIPK